METSSKKMKILIASQTYNRTSNGQGVFVVQLAEGLARAGHQVMVLTPASNAVFGSKTACRWPESLHFR